MSEVHDIFLRAHTVTIDKVGRRQEGKGQGKANEIPKWPDLALVFDTESRTDTRQQLTFGFYRILERNGDTYGLIEEGAFYDDSLPDNERAVLQSYCRTAKMEYKTFPPEFPLHSRSTFVENVFYKYARKGAMIVGFNLPFDLARLAGQWPEGDDDEWSLVLVEYPNGPENNHYSRVLIEPLDSKKAFIRFAPEWVDPENGGNAEATKINELRFVDVRTLLWSLFNKSYSLKRACDNKRGPFKGQNLPQKLANGASGKVTLEEVRYAQWDVKCTAALLNACKKEFDLHRDLDLHPDQNYSPASMAKSYLEAMNIKRPTMKFTIPPTMCGISMASYMGGRSETRLRHEEVPVVPVDFTSEYPSTCALLNLWETLKARRLSFPIATKEVRSLLKKVTPFDCFRLEQWPDYRFFALIIPDKHILPVRTLYNGSTPNIGNNFLTSKKPVWVAGPDLIACKIQSGRVPHIIKAVRIVPHGKQPGMKPVNLRGMVEIDPNDPKVDLFKKVIEQRKLNKSNKELYYWLKIFANAIYGFFVEINPKQLPRHRPVRVRVHTGQESFIPEKKFDVIENQGQWYAPYLASLITSGGRLLLAMLEVEVTKAGGTYLYGDTDALAIVSSERGGSLRHIPGCEKVRALSWEATRRIVDKFEVLNPYDRKAVPGSILNLTDDNLDEDDKRRQLLGFSISAKRYAIYQRDGDKITIINPKAHGLGYLYPPVDSPKGWDDEHEAPKWIYEAWEWILRKQLGLKQIDPPWLNYPQMMRMAVSTQNVLKNLHGWNGFRPYNFFLLPILADFPSSGEPLGVNRDYFRLVAPMESDQTRWMDSACINIGDPLDEKKYKLTTDYTERDRTTAVVATFKDLLCRYIKHPEAKSLAPDGGPCKGDTRGLLRRAHIIAGEHIPIGKETDRKSEEADDLESLSSEPIIFRKTKDHSNGKVKASKYLIEQIKGIGIRELIRFGCGKKILEKICGRELVDTSTLQEYERMVREYKSKEKHALSGS